MNLSNNKYKYHKKNELLDYKDIDTLKKFINDQGKILSRRSTGLNAKQQKHITKSIKRARILALLPFLNKD
uniref:Ribosomal protein S18 n=5 Tax=Delesseriaceae TaxID=31386 RepID=A0A4D6WWX5_9FLOR|nr:ribosomal protein S18 [Membranoptera platyphylla]YP_009332707.1 ribosomal protein S18 [Membranoptera weeksiae]YP_009332927.1 ribosomal protein S18 [Membranoptera tenuis]YP_010156032.1 ribosomal protein S18 [Cumathamnion serrulatum]QCI06055.1 ribosomal protein S18 [Delesseria sanguinea]AHZ94721.1 ribosomal protein S18 [Membranoptera weeksiae]AKL79183.1 ribosomal protein S18 [Membranoptera tenuis]AMJ16964.1 ribosomal protein S18 [Membranoptera platyphylla]QQY85403.1 ribosomal protein S18 [